jgi:proline iminopeptidase
VRAAADGFRGQLRTDQVPPFGIYVSMRRSAKFIPALLVVSGLIARARLNGQGATRAEQTKPLPGDDLIADGRLGAAMAAEFPVPPSQLWPWLVQMGSDRAGFYSWDRLDNGGRPSADRIHTEWQDLKQGDRIASTPDGERWFDVALLIPERALVLRAPLKLPAAQMFDPSVEAPRFYNDSTWAFHLFRTRSGGTRLVVRGVWAGRPRPLLAAGNFVFWDPAHWVMQSRQFSVLRKLVESNAQAVQPASSFGDA